MNGSTDRFSVKGVRRLDGGVKGFPMRRFPPRIVLSSSPCVQVIMKRVKATESADQQPDEFRIQLQQRWGVSENRWLV